MRNEGKHGEIKERAQVVHNFKNCPNILVRVCQCTQSAQWGGKDLRTFSVLISGGHSVEVEDTLGRHDLLDLGHRDTDVFEFRSVKVNGVVFRNGLLVCSHARESENPNLPLFSLIKEIIILEEKEV